MLWIVRFVKVRLRGWRLYVTILLFTFVVSWTLMAVFEPPGAEIAQPANYWWWYVVTAFTVGYGDLFPESPGGRLAALGVMATTIGIAAALINEVIERTAERKSKRTKGLAAVRRHDHIVIVGHVPDRTIRLVEEFEAVDVPVVICAVAGHITEHPFPSREGVDFVRGSLVDDSVFERASVGTARAIIVDTIDGDDDKAALRALVLNRRYPDRHIVVAVNDLVRITPLLAEFGTNFECVDWYDYRLLADAAHDPGISRFYSDIRTNTTSTGTFSLLLPEEAAAYTVGDILVPLKERFNASVCALGDRTEFVNNPALAIALTPGMTLYYIADERLSWSDVRGALTTAGSS